MNNNGNIDNSRVRKVIEPKFQHKYISIILPAVFFHSFCSIYLDAGDNSF